MQIYFNPTFTALTTHKLNGINVLDNFTCRSKKLDLYEVTTTRDPIFDTFITKIKDDMQLDPIAQNEFSVQKNIQYMYIDSMYTINEERNRGLGTCLHLSAIIEMLKNDIKLLELYSKSSAIPFHIRLGFKPSDKWSENLERNLESISQETDERLVKYTQDAQQILNSELDKNTKGNLTNNLIYRYLKDAIKIKDVDELKYTIPTGIIMSLHRDDVIKNKKLYNLLFEKYNIDFQI